MSERLSMRHETQCNVKSGVFYCLTNIIYISLFTKHIIGWLLNEYIYIYIYILYVYVHIYTFISIYLNIYM